MRWYFVATFLIYTLNVTGFRIGKFMLCTSCLKDEPIDLVFWVPYGAFVTAFWFAPHIGQWLLLGTFILFHAVQFIFTYKYWIWPDEKKIESYNRHFARQHHIIKPRDDVLVPDTFHLLLFAKFFVNLVVIIIYIIV